LDLCLTVVVGADLLEVRFPTASTLKETSEPRAQAAARLTPRTLAAMTSGFWRHITEHLFNVPTAAGVAGFSAGRTGHAPAHFDSPIARGSHAGEKGFSKSRANPFLARRLQRDGG